MALTNTPAEAATAQALNPVDLVLRASGVGMAVLLILALAALLALVVWVMKSSQLRALLGGHRKFERAASAALNANDLVSAADRHGDAPGARVVRTLANRQAEGSVSRELLTAVAKRAIAEEEQRASALMPTLSSVASASPFIGLFGTVWGIMVAFLHIGVEKSASLPVVAPAIGEALIATAFGLVAAIPATIGYNYIDKRIADLLEELNASADVWVETLMLDADSAQKPVSPALRTAQRHESALGS